jgi:hypothetical protein
MEDKGMHAAFFETYNYKEQEDNIKWVMRIGSGCNRIRIAFNISDVGLQYYIVTLRENC